MKKGSVLILMIFSIFFVGVANASAEDAKASNAGFSITPFLKEINLSADQKEDSYFLEVGNGTAAPVDVTFSLNDFGASNDGNGVLFLDPKENNKYSLSPWIRLETDRLSLGAGEKKSIKVIISNNENLSPGGHYGAIIANMGKATEDGAMVSLNTKLTALIFLRKSGGETYGLNLEKSEAAATMFSLPQKSHLFFENSGNVHVTARGIVSVVDPLGRTISAGIINSESAIILPESSRMLPVELSSRDMAYMPGRYRIITQYRYDGRDDFSTSEESHWFFPTATVAVMMIVFVLVVIIICRYVWKKGFFIKIRNYFQSMRLEKTNEVIEEKKKHPNVAVSFVVIGGIIFFYLYNTFFQKPVSGEIKTQPSASMDKSSPDFEKLTGSIVSFDYSSAYHINFHETTPNEKEGTLERALLTQFGGTNKKISFLIENFKNHSLVDNASYNLRKKTPTKYTESNFASGDLTGATFISRIDNTFEKDYFIQRGQYLVEISFSSTLDDENQATSEAEAVVRSMQWMQ